MRDSPSAKLSIPNSMDYLAPALAFIREVALACGFKKEELNRIELAAEEAITNVIRHSLPHHETAYFELEVQPLPIGIELGIHDMGRPFDEKETQQYDPDKLFQDREAKGLGSFLIRKLMDVVEYQSLGNKGKRFRMVKYFDNPPVEYDVSRTTPWNFPEEPVQPSTDLAFTIRRFVPDDALALSELAYDTYGYSYLYENVYFPDRLVALNEANEIISIVAITEDGILAGHAGLFCNPAYPGIAEMAMAMVKPEFRGCHLLDRMAALCNETALELGITGLFSQALTLHKRSQPSVKKAGLLPVGFLPAYFPSAEMKGIDNLTKDRITPVVNFKLLRPYHAGTLCFPSRHRDMIMNLLSGVSISWDEAEPFDPAKEQSIFSIQVNEVSSYARMFVYEAGRDIILNLKDYLYRLRKEGLLIGELMLNLNNPATAKLYEEIESLGFIFTGILPASNRGNFITLVYLNGINANFDNIQLIEDYGQDLLEYIRRDYEARFL